MPLVCDDCALPNQPPGLILPCQQGGPTSVYKPAQTFVPAGTKQAPLLHLIYSACAEAFGIEGRSTRKTWLAKKYSKSTGRELTPPKVDFGEDKVRREVQEMVGMLLSQRPHLLPVLGQLDRARQLSAARMIAAMLKGTPLNQAFPTPLDLELMRGAAHVRLERATGELQRRFERMRQRTVALCEDGERLRQRHALTEQALQQAEVAMLNLQGEAGGYGRLMEDAESWRQRVARQLGPYFHEGELLRGDALTFAIDMECDTEEEERGVRALVQEHDSAAQLRERYAESIRGVALRQQQVVAQQEEFVRLLATAEGFYERFERHLLEDSLLQLDLHELSAFAKETRVEREQVQDGAQRESLDADFALRPGNYAKLQECEQLRLALAASGVARQLFLLMHPRLKYIDDATHRCKLHKLLASADVLDAFRVLDEKNLVHPGPHAKLGVMVMNALVPGSYDDRHREMVQSELDGLAAAMDEFGMDRVIRCHSCGHEAPSGRAPEEAAPMWIRDHNPPTALFQLGRAVYHGKLGVADYPGNGVQRGQCLLPQCRECSKRQGSLMARVTKLIEALPPGRATHPNFDLTGHLRGEFVRLDGDAAQWDDFVRVALRPMGGWRAPVDHTPALQNVALGGLVTTGNAGSFTGVDEDLMRRLGVAFGCHTCTDVAVQADPFRNIRWIADHQPPTALVARGLMELPQLVYPHCWKCSDAQAQGMRGLARLYDGCFGKDYKETFAALVREKEWSDL